MQNNSSQNKKKVSIVIPTYNRWNLIKETIDSFLDQTYKNFEIIIVDDGSTDNTPEAIKPYLDNKNISFFSIEHQGYPAPVRNYGIKKATGEFIAFCDDDDLWYPKKLEKQINEFKKDKEIAIVCTDKIKFNERGIIRSFNKKSDKDFSFEALLKNNSITNSSVLVKKSVLDEVGYFDENPDILAGEDWELWLRIAKKYKVSFIKEPLLKYRSHPGALRKQRYDRINLKRNVYKSLLEKKVIDDKLYNKLNNLLKFKEINLRIEDKNKEINFKTVFRFKAPKLKKFRLITKYILVKFNLYKKFISLIT